VAYNDCDRHEYLYVHRCIYIILLYIYTHARIDIHISTSIISLLDDRCRYMYIYNLSCYQRIINIPYIIPCNSIKSVNIYHGQSMPANRLKSIMSSHCTYDYPRPLVEA